MDKEHRVFDPKSILMQLLKAHENEPDGISQILRAEGVPEESIAAVEKAEALALEHISKLCDAFPNSVEARCAISVLHTRCSQILDIEAALQEEAWLSYLKDKSDLDKLL